MQLTHPSLTLHLHQRVVLHKQYSWTWSVSCCFTYETLHYLAPSYRPNPLVPLSTSSATSPVFQSCPLSIHCSSRKTKGDLCLCDFNASPQESSLYSIRFAESLNHFKQLSETHIHRHAFLKTFNASSCFGLFWLDLTLPGLCVI